MPPLQTPNQTLSPACPAACHSLLGLRTNDGRRIQLQTPGAAAAQAAGLVTGTRIQVAGLWMHPEAAPGKPKPAPYFLAASIQVTDSLRVPGVLAKSAAAAGAPPGSMGAAAAAAVAAAAAGPAPRQPPPAPRRPRLSKNQLISNDVSVMFIPSERGPRVCMCGDGGGRVFFSPFFWGGGGGRLGGSGS